MLHFIINHGTITVRVIQKTKTIGHIQLYKKLGLPVIVSVGTVFKHTGSEGEIARDILLSVGIPKEHIIVDDKSLNTEQNAYCCSEIIKNITTKNPYL